MLVPVVANDTAVTQLGDKVLNHVIVGSRHEKKLDLPEFEVFLQPTQIRSDLRTGVIVKTQEICGVHATQLTPCAT